MAAALVVAAFADVSICGMAAKAVVVATLMAATIGSIGDDGVAAVEVVVVAAFLCSNCGVIGLQQQWCWLSCHRQRWWGC